MKITPKQYAEALYDAIKESGEEKSKELIDRFISLISENGDYDQSYEIIQEFNKIWNKKKGIVEARIISSHKFNEKLIDIFRNYIQKTTGTNKVLIKEEIDESILCGVVIKYDDKILDASMKREIEDLKREMKG